jgi:predicted nucleic acid-binding Zn ribbon protein
MKLTTAHCRDCGTKLLGRSDKKFCNDYCRNAYHGKQNRDVSNRMRNINNILRKNRRILLQLIQNNIQTCSNMDLINLGFKSAYSTHYYQDLKGKRYTFYYDISICESNDEFVINQAPFMPSVIFQSKVV